MLLQFLKFLKYIYNYNINKIIRIEIIFTTHKLRYLLYNIIIFKNKRMLNNPHLQAIRLSYNIIIDTNFKEFKKENL